MGCTPWTVKNLADTTGATLSTSIALNELQAAHQQAVPQALVPAGSPMALLNGYASAAQINVYRKMIDEPLVSDDDAAFTVTYCQHMNTLGAPRLANNKARLATYRSPVNNTDNLFNYMLTRYNAAFAALQCAYLGITNALATQTPAANNFPAATVAPVVTPTQAVTVAPVTTTTTMTNNNTLSPTVIVGISIGTALAVGGVIGGVILMKRRKRNEPMLLTSTSDPETYI